MALSYNDLLRVTIEAVREAGDILRADFLQPGGPAGSGAHAEADERAERIIRRRLMETTPDWSYLGEETGAITGTDTQHVWLVDPNDGTSAYLKGYRGSAVSVGLLHDGVPVLGVVHAFAAPDNGGDLFAWAEGCGPLCRNGNPIERKPWSTELMPDTVIAMSHAADSTAAKNIACISPARYLATPSIAYRLALVAAGDAEAAVGLSSPGGWDYAGGHALLRSCGGELVDETGTPVRYGPGGRSQTGSCFGGAPALARELARRPWRSVLIGTTQPAGEPFSPARPARGEAIDDNALLERAQGCWLGQLTGDALGSMVEFKDAGTILRRYPDGLRVIGPSGVHATIAGQATDDSEMALVLARTLLRGGTFDAEAVAEGYTWWLASGPFDVGGTIGQALHAMSRAAQKSQPLTAAGREAANRGSEANGALMRQSPLAIWGHALPAEELARLVQLDTALTHPNPACVDASTAFIVALAATIRDGLDGEGAYAFAVEWDRLHGSSPAVTEALQRARHEAPSFQPNDGHVIIALQNAFYQALHASSVEEGMVASVMGGGDTDTNAAIAGALLGAVHGLHNIPAQWRIAVLSCRPQRGAAGVQQARPPGLWTSDALILAERLLLHTNSHGAAMEPGPLPTIAREREIR